MRLKKGLATIVLGMQYGDEGKGKLVDELAAQAHLVCRVQGGNNAGHTIWVDGKKIVTNIMPSGILQEHCQVGIGAGVAVDVFVLYEEIQRIKSLGYDVNPKRLHVDYRASVILPYHKHMDTNKESHRSQSTKPIGTTGKGVGPTYASRAYRDGPRIADIATASNLTDWLKANPHMAEGLNGDLYQNFLDTIHELRPYFKDLAMIANNQLHDKKVVLIEGAQGAMLDVSFGSYPFVTSSSLVSGSCAGGLGIPPQKIGTVLGVMKAYTTKVGQGPFPSRLEGPFAENLRQRGHEFGSVTGRPRDVGWLDLVALRYFCTLNGVTHLALMKGDVLSGIDAIGVVKAYHDRSAQAPMIGYPITPQAWERVEPVIEFYPGWDDVVSTNNLLNPAYRHFINTIEGTLQTPIGYISTGAARNSGFWR